jgi:hypothetical protein
MTRRAYLCENELLLMEDGVPAIKAMTAATQGKIRVYLTDGDTIITHGVKPLKWPLFPTSSIYSGLDIAWIDMRLVYILSEKDMHAFEAWMRNPVEGTPWDALVRPVLRPPRTEKPAAAVPNRITQLALLGAEASGAICPITTEPIRASHATMTPCGHIFDRAALASWTATNPVCPECRAPL